jgi:uncharacterized damage-inducible protein DinB
MDRDSLLPFVRYHAWANDRIITTAGALSDEELRRDGVLDHGSAFQTLRHLVDVDWSWRQFLLGNPVGDTYVWDHGFVLDDLPAIHAFSIEEGDRWRRYVESLDDAALLASLAMSEEPDDVLPRWLIVVHVVNHGTQHRSELARYLTECGHSPGELDLLDAFSVPWPSATATDDL